jgi:hypothetical protein
MGWRMSSGRKHQSTGSLWKRTLSMRRPSGPQAGFLAATLAGFLTWGVSKATLPFDMVMPIVASVLLGSAAVFALIAWRSRRFDPSQVNYLDAAGALALIGCFAAMTIDPDQLMRLVESRPND